MLCVPAASPKAAATSLRSTGLPKYVAARYGGYGQRFRVRRQSPERKRRWSATGHRILFRSIMAPSYSEITLNC
jgi:hypothetical protein